MNKSNYIAWEIEPKLFPEQSTLEEQVKFILKFGILAPSGHNSQPWQCKVASETITISIPEERALSKSDPRGKVLSLSLGCLVETIATAADYFGFDSEISFAEGIKDPIVVNLKRTRQTFQNKDHPIFLIAKRHSDRTKYTNDPIPEDLMKKISALSDQDISMNILTSEQEEKRILVAQIMADAQINAMESADFREELSHFVLSNYSKQYFGMPGFTLGMPGPISLLAPRLIRKINLSKLSKKQDKALLLEHTPAMGIIFVGHESRQNWIKAGRVLLRSWLLATKEGVSVSPLAAASQDETYAKKIKEVLGSNMEPSILFRLGFSKSKLLHSPRLVET